MSQSDDIQSEPDSSSDSLNQSEERTAQENHHIEDMLLNYSTLRIGDPSPRARRRICERQREIGDERLMNDYFVERPTYSPQIFRRRFRMQKALFLRIVEAVTTNDEYFQQRRDATGRQSLAPLQKCTAAMRVLAYGTSTDAVDEYLRVSGAVVREALEQFVDGVISCFRDQYLRKPNQQDLAKLLYVGEQRGFPGMIGSIDRMRWEWKNCPTAWAGQYAGRSGKPTIILEVVASYDLWIWHAFFGTPDSTVEEDGDQPFQYSTARIASLASYMINRQQLRNKEAHEVLRGDLIEHIWQKFGPDS